MDRQVCQFLLKQLGTDQSLLYQEIEKLFCYVGDRSEITLQDVSMISTSVNVENVWQLGDAIFRCDVNSALRISKALLNDGTALLALLRQIRSQFQTKFQICSILKNGGTSAEVVQQYPYMKGNILERNMQMALNYGMPRFKKGMIKIDETELQAKNSGADSDILLELLIAAIAT